MRKQKVSLAVLDGWRAELEEYEEEIEKHQHEITLAERGIEALNDSANHITGCDCYLSRIQCVHGRFKVGDEVSDGLHDKLRVARIIGSNYVECDVLEHSMEEWVDVGSNLYFAHELERVE